MDPRALIAGSGGGGSSSSAAAAAHPPQPAPAQTAAASSSSSHRSHHPHQSSLPVALPRELALLKSELRWDASEPLAPSMPIETAMKAKRGQTAQRQQQQQTTALLTVHRCATDRLTLLRRCMRCIFLCVQ